MKTLYTAGYQDIRKAEKLLAMAVDRDAIVADIRQSPNSRDPQWKKAALAELLGERYLHLPEFGNKNYRGGPIELADASKGITIVEGLLAEKAVILLCACWNLKECHRHVAAEQTEAALGCVLVHLTRADFSALKVEPPKEPPAPDKESQSGGQLTLLEM